MLFAARQSLVVWVGTDRTPSDVEWNVYVAALAAIAKRDGRIRVVVFPLAGAPTPKQRKHLASQLYELPQRASVITASIIARGVTTVLRWLGADIQAFAPSDRERAFEFIELTPDEAEWVDERERALRARLEPAARAVVPVSPR